MLMTRVQLTVAEAYDTQIVMHTSTANKDISLARGFQKNILDPSHKNGVVDQGKYIK